MTRKDYILIAGALREVYKKAEVASPTAIIGNSGVCALDYAATQLAISLRLDNPRFNDDHFMAVVRGEKDLTSRPSRDGVQ